MKLKYAAKISVVGNPSSLYKFNELFNDYYNMKSHITSSFGYIIRKLADGKVNFIYNNTEVDSDVLETFDNEGFSIKDISKDYDLDIELFSLGLEDGIQEHARCINGELDIQLSHLDDIFSVNDFNSYEQFKESKNGSRLTEEEFNARVNSKNHIIMIGGINNFGVFNNNIIQERGNING